MPISTSTAPPRTAVTHPPRMAGKGRVYCRGGSSPGTRPAPGLARTPCHNRPVTRRGRSARAALIALALLPIAVLLTRVGFQDWHPAGDAAVLALRVAEVGTSHTPLVGPYSRFGWAHPGPMLAYSLALPYRVLGNRGLLVGSLAISGLSVFILVRTLL